MSINKEIKKKKEIILLSLDNSTSEELSFIADNFGISKEGNIRANIIKAFIGVSTEEKTEEILEEAEEKYNFKIKSAQTIECSSINDKDFIFVSGNVEIEFDLGGVQRILKADSILFDVSEQEILAFGHISISSSGDNSQLQNLSSKILFLNFNNNKIR